VTLNGRINAFMPGFDQLMLCSNQRRCGPAECEWGYGDEGNALK